ncbi:hypothetical protein [Paenarthrobacter nicotinovorans]|uniref:hypothetical protein n=1 Tax=Paenarthrobacter nicotinovorans TaxID=29320 RepID=UPI003D6721CC
MQWKTFISSLTHDVDWHSKNYVTQEQPKVERLLHQVQADPGAIKERILDILADDTLYKDLEPYTDYPRTLMDKFTIYVAPGDQFRVRVHRFWPKNIAGNAIEKVHYHKWHMSTVILDGSYTERRFLIEDLDEENRRAETVETDKRELLTGEVSSLAATEPHQVHNASDDEPCLTLFVRGPALQDHARIFNDDGTFYDTYSPTPQRKRALRALAELNGHFHPLPER